MMRKLLQAACFLVALGGPAYAQRGIYWIGNSLTNDCLVQSNIPGTATNAWHIDCGVSLDYIYLNPSDPCVAASTIWTTALASNNYSAISFQPHGNTAFETCVSRIKSWSDSQPSAKLLIIHTSWDPYATHVADYEDEDTSFVHKSAAFMDALQARLESEYPNRKVKQTYTHAVLYDIAQDIIQDNSRPAEFTALSYMYRDTLHMSAGGANDGAGRYMAMNCMRRALGLPYGEYSGCTASAAVKAYIRGKIETYHPRQPITGSFQ